MHNVLAYHYLGLIEFKPAEKISEKEIGEGKEEENKPEQENEPEKEPVKEQETEPKKETNTFIKGLRLGGYDAQETSRLVAQAAYPGKVSSVI